jgi:hypothetical protein
LVFPYKDHVPKDDPQFASLLKRFCIKKATDADVCLVYSRQIKLNEDQSTLDFKPILLTSNLLRVAFNWCCCKIFGISSKTPSMQFHTRVIWGRHSTLTASERRSLNCLRDDKTNWLLMVLELAIGMPVICTKNNSGPRQMRL